MRASFDTSGTDDAPQDRTGRPQGRVGGAQRRLRVLPRRAPTGGLGLLWAALLLVSSAAAPSGVAIVVVPVALVAGASLARTGGAVGRTSLWAGLGAAVVPVAAVGGVVVAPVVLLVAVGAVAVAGTAKGEHRPRIFLPASVAAPGAAAASLVLAARGSAGVALCLAAAVCLFDLANYVIGTGDTGGVIGAIAGIVTVAVFAVLAAAVVNPPLSGARPWLLFALVAGLAPLGVAFGHRLARGVRLPAVLRLDSLFFAGPAWVVASQLMLH